MLNPREGQVTALLLEGYDNRGIAKQLGLAERTVKDHFRRIFLHFNVTDGIKRVKLAVILNKPPFKPRISIPLFIDIQFTPKEKTVIQLVANGWKNKEIAEAIGTTESVIKNYLRIIYDKTGVWSRLELALWYVPRDKEQS